MKVFFIGLMLCLSAGSLQAQNIKELKIGDTLPAMNISLLRDGNVQQVPLNSLYKNRFIIIDFWATWCGACINAIADADSAGRSFKEKFSVIPWTYEGSNTIRDFVAKNKKLSGRKLDYVVNDSIVMGLLFRFTTIPHEIWIDTAGVIKAITYPEEATHENLSRFVNMESLTIEEKKDDVTFNPHEPLTIENNNFLYRSVLTPYRAGHSSMIGAFIPSYQPETLMNRFFAVDQYILSMFYAAYSKNQGNVQDYRIELQVKDTNALYPGYKNKEPSKNIIKKNAYCYELILPQKISQDSFYSCLLDDLNRLFPYKATVEKREKLCWVIKNVNKNKNPAASFSGTGLVWEGGFIKKLNNQTMSLLTEYLNWNMDLPVVNETNFNVRFDMSILLQAVSNGETVFLDPATVKQSLGQYGFELIKATRPVDILVIRKK